VISKRLREKKLFEGSIRTEKRKLAELDKLALDETEELVELIVAVLRGVAINATPEVVEEAEDYIIELFEKYEAMYFSKTPRECVDILRGRR
jgi:hypothetical protein